jgi:hypothetical protein
VVARSIKERLWGDVPKVLHQLIVPQHQLKWHFARVDEPIPQKKWWWRWRGCATTKRGKRSHPPRQAPFGKVPLALGAAIGVARWLVGQAPQALGGINERWKVVEYTRSKR